jgi:nitrogen-specific signal transduction histidine kinase
LEKSQAALQQAQKMEAIGNLTGGIAHDFNNLLQGLSGNLDLIRRRPDDAARVQRWAESGLQAAERGAKLTAQLLTFSRSQKLELRALDLAELLPSMRELLKRTLGPSVEVALDLEPGKQAVLGDETQLEMAVLNLAINARDAMPDGGKLSISTKSRTLSDDAELAPGDYVELSVSDTGSGMASDVMARAFDPFFTTKGVGKGTGLGLSQVYGMIRQAGGTARIQSTSGKGTTVSLFLRKTSQSASIAVQHDHDRPADKTHTAKILVIDDDPGVRQFLNDSLSAFGYNVSEAENGPAGLSLLQSFVPDLTVIDFAMPGMTGAEVAKKARMQRPDLPVIFASGYADTEAIESQRDEHTAVLRKPFRISELQDAITRLLIR